MLKTFTVFNLEQIDDLTLTEEDTAEPINEFYPLPHVEALFQRTDANITERSQQAFFVRLQTKSGFRSVIYSLMLPTFTLQSFMSLFTG